MSMLVMNTYIFVLSCIIGYFVIWGVTAALHTPLMAVTNAISGIVLIGAMFVAGDAHGFAYRDIIGFLAVFFASINIFGGFVVTNRMLSMFKEKR
jgi:H+-translocating NAD(P) transhydrogenase subunit alpha